MGTFKNGSESGRFGNTVTYLLNGKLVTRRIGKSNKPATKLQAAVRLRTKLTSKFLRPLKEFVLVGFELDARRLKQQADNRAFAYNWRYATKGKYPDIFLNFPKVLLAFGTMPAPKSVTVVVVEDGFSFHWAPQEGRAGTHWSDQVMLVAYFPLLKTAAYMTAGAARYKGTDLLPIFDIAHGAVAETYIAFISNDRRSISRSVYAGRVTW